MAGTRERTPVDERVMVSGTTVRFVQMIVLMVVATAGLATVVALPVVEGERLACVLAAGLDPERVTYLNVAHAFGSQQPALDTCLERHVTDRFPDWLVIAWPALLGAVAAALFKALPAWKIRRRRLEPLTDETVLARLRALAAEAGLDALPACYVDPRRLTARAVTFGGDRRPVVRLNRGLVWLAERDAERFRAVVLHEFAHIRNRDVTVTYTTTAMWWAFILVVALPFAALELAALPGRLQSALGAVELISTVRLLAMALASIALVHFARQEVLRSREMHADSTAKRWGADLRRFDFGAEPTPKAGAPARAKAALGGLLRAHPTLATRRRVLGDNAELFAVRAPLVLLTGVGAVLIGDQASAALSQLPYTGPGAASYAALTAGALVAGVIGTALWRAVVFAAIAGTRAPSGVPTGLWLGAGLVLGELLRGRAGEFQWTPPNPELLPVLLAVGLAFGWWTSACARLWTSVWRSRSIAPVTALVLTGGAVAFAAALQWWQEVGLVWANGFGFETADILSPLTGDHTADSPAHEPLMTAVAVAYQVLASFGFTPFLWSAVAALWIVPLLAWAVRHRQGRLWTVRKGGRSAPEILPPLRRLLAAALIGAAVSWTAVAASMALLHRGDALGDRPAALAIAVLVAVVAAATITGAAAASATAAAIVDRFRLSAALIAANLAVGLGLAGAMAVLATDGCVAALTVVSPRCGMLSPDASWGVIQTVAQSIAVLAAALAFVTAALAATAAKVRARPLREARRANRPARLPTRAAVAAICAAAVGFTASAEALTLRADHQAHGQDAAWLRPAEEPTDPSPHARTLQVVAWLEVGGSDLLDRFNGAFDALADLDEHETDESVIEDAELREACAELVAATDEAHRYFAIPEAEAQARWSAALTVLGESAQACVNGFDQRNQALILASFQGLLEGLTVMTESARLAAEAATAGAP